MYFLQRRGYEGEGVYALHLNLLSNKHTFFYVCCVSLSTIRLKYCVVLLRLVFFSAEPCAVKERKKSKIEVERKKRKYYKIEILH
jgi:hypothetical protein